MRTRRSENPRRSPKWSAGAMGRGKGEIKTETEKTKLAFWQQRFANRRSGGDRNKKTEIRSIAFVGEESGDRLRCLAQKGNFRSVLFGWRSSCFLLFMFAGVETRKCIAGSYRAHVCHSYCLFFIGVEKKKGRKESDVRIGVPRRVSM